MPDVEDLRLLYSELQTDMRFRRNTEFRYFSFATGLSTAALPVGVTLTNNVSDRPALQLAFVGISLITLMVNIFTTTRIRHENKIYRSLGATTVRILGKLELLTNHDDSILPASANSYGQGTGYRWTLTLLWIVYALVTAALAVIAFYSNLAQAAPSLG